ncbi:unnamed protein product, partial [Didymodactylos carnosus]
SVSVGTIEPRSIIEPIRSLISPRIKFIENKCINIDPKKKFVTCINSRHDGETSTITNKDEVASASSSEEVLDSTQSIKYDFLVVAVGSQNNTFNTPDVEKYAHFLKEITDAIRLRAAISDAFESAMSLNQSEEDRKRLLHFVIVGGGPTGVEFAAELADYVQQDLKYYFPSLVANDVKISLIQSLDHILSTMVCFHFIYPFYTLICDGFENTLMLS